MSSQELWLTWSEIVHRTKNRRLVFFGRGEWMEKARNYLPREADYIVDNSPYEQGQSEYGIAIHHPDKLKDDNWDEIFVIVATTGFPEVSAQLNSFGMRAGAHYCVSPSLRSFGTITRVQDHKQRVYLTCSDQMLDDSKPIGGGLFSLDMPSGEVTKILTGVCHGMAESDENIFVVDDQCGVRVLDRAMGAVDQFALPPKSRPHGITYCAERKQLFVCQSGRDSIGIYDATTLQPVDEIFLSDKFQRTGIPQHHCNDPCAYGNSLYVGMFSFSGNWKLGVYDGGLLEIDIDAREVRGPVVSDLWLPHTPTVINGALHYCDSMRGRIHSTTWKTMTEFHGFIRGIAWDGEFYYVGQSMHRYIERRRGTTNNISLDTGVFLLDPDGQATKFFPTPGLTDINSVFIPGAAAPQ